MQKEVTFKNFGEECAIAREEAGLTQEEAAIKSDEYSDEPDYLSSKKISKIETETTKLVTPEDVQLLAKIYKCPELCDSYCLNKCAIGKDKNIGIELDSASEIALNLIVNLEELEKIKNRLAEITLDGKVDDSEMDDLIIIKDKIEKMLITVMALHSWVEKQEALKED